MSWGPITASNVPLADIDAELANAANAYRGTLASVGQEIKPEVAEQIDAAIPAAKSLAESGAVGTGRDDGEHERPRQPGPQAHTRLGQRLHHDHRVLHQRVTRNLIWK